MEIKGFITNLGKYNEGELVGKWVTFPIDEDEVNEVLTDIGCLYYDEEEEDYFPTQHEEFFFTDWDCDFSHEFGEYESIDRMNELAEALEEWDEDTFEAVCEVWGMREALEHSPDDYMLLTHVQSDYDLGEYYAVECYCVDFEKDSILTRYFDFEAFGRDLGFELDGGFSSLGWVEFVG